MKASRRFAAACAAALTAVAVGGGTALAAPPSNDTFAGAAVIASVPFTATLDTTEATTDADDAELNAECGAPATDASVWYSLTPTTDGTYVADMTQSNYFGGFIVATGSPGSFSLLACGPDTVGWEAVAGETYYILVFDDQFDGGGNGGELRLTVDLAPPPPTLEVTVNDTARFDARTGTATLSGTIMCGSNADFAFIDVMVTQEVGRRFVVRGFGFTEITCDDTFQPWTVEVFPDGGQFKGGQALSVAFSVACNLGGCSEYIAEQKVRLMGKK